MYFEGAIPAIPARNRLQAIVLLRISEVGLPVARRDSLRFWDNPKLKKVQPLRIGAIKL